MSKESKIAMPTVLAFEKKMVPSDARMYAVDWNNRKNEAAEKPLKIVEKSVRGTISNRLKSTVKNDPAKLNAEVQKANLQTVDNCALDWNSDTLKLKFSLKFLAGVGIPSVCNNSDFQIELNKAVQTYITNEGFTELGYRYALNIANGRFLWRNRVGAEEVEVIVNINNKSYAFDSTQVSLNDFTSKNDEIAAVGTLISETLRGEREFLMLNITAFCKMGKGQEVYPSEELVLDKGAGKKSKILYSIDDIAGIHSQKIGNALRTIDTWYPHENPEKILPIAAEPFGAVTTLGTAFRNPKDKADFYSLFDKWALGDDSYSIEDKHFIMAVLVRGGVFGEGTKD